MSNASAKILTHSAKKNFLFHDTTTYFSKLCIRDCMWTQIKNVFIAWYHRVGVIARALDKQREKYIFFFGSSHDYAFDYQAAKSHKQHFLSRALPFWSLSSYMCTKVHSRQASKRKKEEEKNGERKLSFEAQATRRGENSKGFPHISTIALSTWR